MPMGDTILSNALKKKYYWPAERNTLHFVLGVRALGNDWDK